jgi:hypothetical protein
MRLAVPSSRFFLFGRTLPSAACCSPSVTLPPSKEARGSSNRRALPASIGPGSAVTLATTRSPSWVKLSLTGGVSPGPGDRRTAQAQLRAGIVERGQLAAGIGGETLLGKQRAGQKRHKQG